MCRVCSSLKSVSREGERDFELRISKCEFEIFNVFNSISPPCKFEIRNSKFAIPMLDSSAMSGEKSAGGSGAGNIAVTLSRRLGMVIVLALAFFMSATVTIYTLFRSGDTRVPNVVGKSETEAQQIALKAGLNVKIQRRSDDKIPPNTVIETRPAPNSSVKKESALTIVVSTGPVQKSEAENRFSFLVSRFSFGDETASLRQ